MIKRPIKPFADPLENKILGKRLRDQKNTEINYTAAAIVGPMITKEAILILKPNHP